MATLADARRIALSLPATDEDDDGLSFGVLNKGKSKKFAWAWRERIDPKKARVRNPNVLAVSVESLEAKAILLASDPAVIFTEDHYNGYPAILVRLAAIQIEDLEQLLVDAWRVQAPKALVAEFDAAL